MPGDMVAFYFAQKRAYRVVSRLPMQAQLAKCFQQLCQRDSKHCPELVPGDKFMKNTLPTIFQNYACEGISPDPL